MHRILKDERFHKWYLSHMVKCHRHSTGEGAEGLKVKLKDSLAQEVNQLSFILEGFYPRTRPDNAEGVVFITNPIEHFMFGEGDTSYGIWRPGAATVTFKGVEPVIAFEDRSFVHGHIAEGGGTVKCWGGYRHFATTATNDGLAAALAELHLFISRSRYGTTHRDGKRPEPATKEA